MSTPQASLQIAANAREVFSYAESPAGSSEADRTITLSNLKLSASLSATSLPKVDKPPVYRKLTATATIDLTAVQAASIPSTATRSFDMTGAKVKAAFLKAGVANTGTVIIAPGAANPYPIFGAGNEVDLGPGAFVPLAFDGVESNLPAVSGTVKNIDISITGSDTVEILLLLGT